MAQEADRGPFSYLKKLLFFQIQCERNPEPYISFSKYILVIWRQVSLVKEDETNKRNVLGLKALISTDLTKSIYR